MLNSFNNNSIVAEGNLLSAFYSYLSEDNNQNVPDTHDYMINIYQTLMGVYIIKSNNSTVWEGKGGFAKQYRCALAVYLVEIASLTFKISMDRAIFASGHGTDVVDVLNARCKKVY